MQVVIGLPGLIAALYLLSRTPARAFLNVYLPALLLLPNYYRWVIAGLPDPTFAEAAIIPIAMAAAIRQWRLYRISITDFAVLSYAGVTAISEYQAKGFADAENLLFDVLATCLAPYCLAKLLIEPEGLRVSFAKQFVKILALIAFLGLYELRMGDHPLVIIWEKMFPDRQVWGEQFRYGLARTKLTFGGSILAATIFAVGCLLQFWLIRSGKWAKKERLLPQLPFRLPKLPISTPTCLTLGLLAGLLMPDSRGPLFGLIVGFIILFVGQARNIRRSFAIWTPILLVSGYFGAMTLENYASVDRSQAATAEQETAAYRKDLLVHYIGVVQEKPMLGWGVANFPVLEGQWSVDNHYLLLALNSGLVGLATFCLTLAICLARLFSVVFSNHRQREDRLFALTLASSIIAIAISIISVFLGEQVYLLLFLLIGWAEGCVVYQYTSTAETAAIETFETKPVTLPFRHVVRRVGDSWPLAPRRI